MSKRYLLLSHIGAWMLMILPTFFLMFGDFDEISTNRLTVFLVNSLFTILNFYFFYSFIIPALYNKKKAFVLVLITLFFLILYPLLQFEIFQYLQNHFEIMWKRVKYKDYFLSQAYTTTFLYTGVAYLAYFTIKWIREKQEQADMITQNQASELALLRSQINPHFLFNTLNNIYSLVLKKSDVAPEAMMKLSDIMRYMLYETNTDKVPLEKEVKYLESYIELMRLRIKKQGMVEFKVNGDLNKKEIAPMLLVPFVENAFKHADKKSETSPILIELSVDQNQLIFMVSNAKKSGRKEELSTEGGIGLQNIKRRLNLLYKGKSKLEIFEENSQFKIRLNISF